MTKGMIYILSSQGFFFMSGYLLQVYVGRSLGPELYGIFGLITVFHFIFERLIGGSFSKGISKFVAENESASRSIIGFSMRLQYGFSLLTLLVFYGGADLIAAEMGDGHLAEYFRLLSLLIVVSGVYIVYSSALNGARAFREQAILAVAFGAARLFFVAGLVYLGYSLKGAVWGLVLAGVACMVLSIRMCRPLAGKGDFDGRELVSYSVKVTMFTVAMLLIMNIDLVAVKLVLKDNLATGLYNAVLNLARIPTLVTIPVSIVLFPLIVKAVSDGNNELAAEYSNRTLRYLVILLVPFPFLVHSTSRELLTLVYGGAYSGGSAAFGVLIYGLTFIGIAIIMNTIILAVRDLKVFIYFNMIVVAADVTLNYLLIGRFGIAGAAIATTAVGFACCLFSIVYVFRFFEYTVKARSYVNVLLSSAAVYLISAGVPASGALLLIKYLFLYAAYFAILAVLREFGEQDRKMFRDLLPAPAANK
ncbi:MAG: oligosaccharide flippase family protein [Deltaproteobacteria bacterium]|nr:oligosaccharide flippase family protein [Deltaproteobacteria bacterium]